MRDNCVQDNGQEEEIGARFIYSFSFYCFRGVIISMASIKELKIGNYIVNEGEICEVRNISFEGNSFLVELKGLFSGKEYSLNLNADNQIEEADVIRKCAQIVSKKDKGIEIMDCNNFKTFTARIDDSLLSNAEEGDQVTYIRFNDSVKILEVRKDI